MTHRYGPHQPEHAPDTVAIYPPGRYPSITTTELPPALVRQRQQLNELAHHLGLELTDWQLAAYSVFGDLDREDFRLAHARAAAAARRCAMRGHRALRVVVDEAQL